MVGGKPCLPLQCGAAVLESQAWPGTLRVVWHLRMAWRPTHGLAPYVRLSPCEFLLIICFFSLLTAASVQRRCRVVVREWLIAAALVG